MPDHRFTREQLENHAQSGVGVGLEHGQIKIAIKLADGNGGFKLVTSDLTVTQALQVSIELRKRAWQVLDEARKNGAMEDMHDVWPTDEEEGAQ